MATRRAPQWVGYDQWSRMFTDDCGEIPQTVVEIMGEVYAALRNNSRRLVAMGVRATLEAVMIDKVNDNGNFAANVDKLQEAGYLSAKDRMNLDTILDVGHAAIHRGWEPTEDENNTLLDITENLIEKTYIHGPRAERLAKVVQKRSKSRKP